MQHVGIDFSSGIELAQHTEALGPDGGSGSARTESPADAEAGLPSSTDTAFFLYYDEVAEKYDMRDPLVVAPDGSEVECSKPSSLERGVRYFCVVTLKDGGYAAEVLPESEAEGKGPGGYDALWKVHLFNVPKEGEEDYGEEEPGHEDGMQYHTGAVVVGGGGGGGGVTPDGASTEFRSDGDGHDGELQLKDFHDFGASKDENTLADYLADGTKADDYQCLVRAKTTGQHTQALGYVPLGQLTPPYEEGDNIEISDPDDDGKRTISAKVPEPDGVSTELVPHDSAQGADNSDEGKLQIRGWNKGTPVSDTTLAADLQVQTPVQGHVLFRGGSGALEYKAIGQLPGGGGKNYWVSGGDSHTCFGTEIKIGNVLIYEATV